MKRAGKSFVNLEETEQSEAQDKKHSAELGPQAQISEGGMAIRVGEIFFPQDGDTAIKRPIELNTRTPQ